MIDFADDDRPHDWRRVDTSKRKVLLLYAVFAVIRCGQATQGNALLGGATRVELAELLLAETPEDLQARVRLHLGQ